MSAIRFVLRDLSVSRLWGAWTRSFIVNAVVRRCRRERAVREVFQCFRQTILRPRRTFLLSAAAFKSRDDTDDTPPNCADSISDEDMEALVSDLEAAETLARRSIYCAACGRRLALDKRLPAVRYCACADSRPTEEAPDGWTPYMEAEDVVIWRKEYRPGTGLYAYKVYGRYKEVRAQDFAGIQVDGVYRRAWDAAVAALAVVEQGANGVRDQAVLHWEVLWPRLFANRDYVYIRRHKEFDVGPSRPGAPEPPAPPPGPRSVHDHAKRASQRAERRCRTPEPGNNKAFVIVSRSCRHPAVPETRHAIRVLEYWSHMVVRSLHGVAEPGMEFVLTYYDSPNVGGRGSSIADWATGRAAAAYLRTQRHAAAAYPAWTRDHPPQDAPDFIPFGETNDLEDCPPDSSPPSALPEQDMKSSKHGPELENKNDTSREKSTQTDAPSEPTNEQTDKPTIDVKKPVTENAAPISEPNTASDKEANSASDNKIKSTTDNETKSDTDKEAKPSAKTPTKSVTEKESKSAPEEESNPAADNGTKPDSKGVKHTIIFKMDKRETQQDSKVETSRLDAKEQPTSDLEGEKSEEETPANNSWWRYLYPFYYFV